ncbi:MAG: hypothetical protein ACRDM7_00705 [Thermoleophilaceae bacterium]
MAGRIRLPPAIDRRVALAQPPQGLSQAVERLRIAGVLLQCRSERISCGRPIGGGEDYGPTLEPQAVVDDPSSAGGFDLVSALLGATVGAGLLIVLVAATGLARRRPLTRRHGTVGA